MHLLEGFAFYQEWKQCYLQRPVRPPLPKLPRYMRGTEQQQAERLKADYARKVHTLSVSLSLSLILTQQLGPRLECGKSWQPNCLAKPMPV